jgi:D-threo-aldose 1-dehydrogenase
MSEAVLRANCCPRRRWGKSGIAIPVIPFGTQGFGDHFGVVTEDEAMGLIRRAVDLGVNHFDCARCYGNSLGKLGLAIKQGVVRRDEITISGRICCHSAAKWGGYGEGDPDYSAERAAADAYNQLEILGTTFFDALFIHDPKAIEPSLSPGGTLDGIRKLKAEGVTRNVGYGMWPPEFHLKAIREGDVDVLLTFDRYNLLGQGAAQDIIPAATEKDVGILNGWSIKRGLLTGTPVDRIVPREKWKPGSEPERAEKMRLWCSERGISLLQLALQFCLREERIHGNPLGNLNIQQLEANVSAALSPLPASVFEEFTSAGL